MTSQAPGDLLGQLRAAMLDLDGLIRAIGTGRSRGSDPVFERVECRPVALAAGPVLQVTGRTGPRVSIRNLPATDPVALAAAVDALLAGGYRTWHVETATSTLQVRTTKKGALLGHTGPPPVGARPGPAAHDRTPQRLIDPDDPLFALLGADGAKRRQVDAFLRNLQATLRRATRVLPPGALRVVDLGCGNAYLTMAAHRYLSASRPGTVTIGVDARADLVASSAERAERAGLTGLGFVTGTIADAPLDPPDVVLALHACDTATDQALARALTWQTPVVLAAPCCHHDVQRQLQDGGSPPGMRAVTRHPILRERLGDLLTDAIRAAILREHGYQVEVVEFIGSEHTARNVLLRAVRTGALPSAAQQGELRTLLTDWQLRPALTGLLGADPATARSTQR